jgi:hypothetical protein
MVVVVEEVVMVVQGGASQGQLRWLDAPDALIVAIHSRVLQQRACAIVRAGGRGAGSRGWVEGEGGGICRARCG